VPLHGAEQSCRGDCERLRSLQEKDPNPGYHREMTDWMSRVNFSNHDKCSNCGRSLSGEIERSQLAKDRPNGITEADASRPRSAGWTVGSAGSATGFTSARKTPRRLRLGPEKNVAKCRGFACFL
jgi:hypothetical protein